ncbi:unnamed protein product [Lactuca saligna]|uniref:ATP-dependent DNA helicase n=1 Tax=Lactuca saligna TaxID=75948 RepID=A0AA35Y947_LACSI|nr:unnamed protein product [Lactuca saligna]
MFKEAGRIEDVLRNPGFARTLLLGRFDSNATDPQDRDLTYIDYPNRYVWDARSKEWGQRVLESSKSIGRLVFVHPSSGELFYIRMLLCHQKGCTSYEDVRTVHGHLHPTFRSACNALGLIGEDMEWLTAFIEASSWATSSQLRSLFCHLLLFCDVSNPQSLWDVAWRKMIDDYLLKLKTEFPDKRFHMNDDIVQQQLLFELENALRSSTPSRSLANFHLPVTNPDTIVVLENRLLLEESSYDKESLQHQHSQMFLQLNEDQMRIYKTVVKSEENKKQVLLFVYGHGGTGKTFLWTTLLAYFRSIGKIVLAVAASEIASLLLPSGRTAHSRFNIPINLAEKKSCDIKKRTLLGDLLKRTSLIIWDEAPMSDRRCFEYLDRSLRDVLECEKRPFGGISVLLGGEFRQTLPVSPKSSRTEIIALTLPNSYLWSYFEVCTLHHNMRLTQTTTDVSEGLSIVAFADWLLNIGNGTLGVPDADNPHTTTWVEIPPSLLIPIDSESLKNLILFVYGNRLLDNPSPSDLSVRAIVCPTNDIADKLNVIILEMVKTDERVYKSTDAMQPNGKYTSELEGLYPIEYLNQLTFAGIPPHTLKLKIKDPIMLLRNINQREGLCNGTRDMTNISDLKYACEGGALQVRILHKWKPQYRRYETWYLGVDKYGDAIQILGQRTNQGYIESIFHISNCYTISEYTCPYLDEYQKVLENEIYMDVGLISIIVPLPDTVTILATWFRFASKTDLLNLGENPSYYPDFIGVLKKMRNCTKRNGEEFVLLILADESGDEIAISLRKECIDVREKFRLEELATPPATTVVAITNIKPSSIHIAGTLRFGSSPATHVYVNPPIQETTLLIHSFTGPTPPTSTASGPLTTLHELNNKIHSELVDKIFNVKATLTTITFKDCWFQVLCTTCKDPIFRKSNYWSCSAHGKTASPIFLYKLITTLTEPTGFLTTIMTDGAAQKLIGATPEKLMTDDHESNKKLPPTLINDHEGTSKTMSIQMLKGSTTENIRFIIVDIHEVTMVNQSVAPVTPTQVSTTTTTTTPITPADLQGSANVEINPILGMASTTSQTSHTARTLTYDTAAESVLKKQPKRGRRAE